MSWERDNYVVGVIQLCRGNETLCHGNETIMLLERDIMSWGRDKKNHMSPLCCHSMICLVFKQTIYLMTNSECLW